MVVPNILLLFLSGRSAAAAGGKHRTMPRPHALAAHLSFLSPLNQSAIKLFSFLVLNEFCSPLSTRFDPEKHLATC